MVSRPANVKEIYLIPPRHKEIPQTYRIWGTLFGLGDCLNALTIVAYLHNFHKPATSHRIVLRYPLCRRCVMCCINSPVSWLVGNLQAFLELWTTAHDYRLRLDVRQPTWD